MFYNVIVWSRYLTSLTGTFNVGTEGRSSMCSLVGRVSVLYIEVASAVEANLV